jgi:hypothetical protein
VSESQASEAHIALQSRLLREQLSNTRYCGLTQGLAGAVSNGAVIYILMLVKPGAGSSFTFVGGCRKVGAGHACNMLSPVW